MYVIVNSVGLEEVDGIQIKRYCYWRMKLLIAYFDNDHWMEKKRKENRLALRVWSKCVACFSLVCSSEADTHQSKKCVALCHWCAHINFLMIFIVFVYFWTKKYFDQKIDLYVDRGGSTGSKFDDTVCGNLGKLG